MELGTYLKRNNEKTKKYPNVKSFDPDWCYKVLSYNLNFEQDGKYVTEPYKLMNMHNFDFLMGEGEKYYKNKEIKYLKNI